MKGGRKKMEVSQALRPNDEFGNVDGAGGVGVGVGAASLGEAGDVTVVVGVGGEGVVVNEEEETALVTTEELNEGEEEEDEEEEGEEARLGMEDGDEDEVGVEGEGPKLAEGFYEIEDVRNRRVRKGQVQYLIKWRGWPETANTWEPYENLQSCYDVIEAFEESRRAGKSRWSRSSRKRKRKTGTTHSQPKRKQRSNPNSSIAKLRGTVDSQPSTTLDNASLFNVSPRGRVEAGNATDGNICWDTNNKHEDINNEKPTQQPNDNGTNEDGLSKAKDVELDRNSRFTGARRRKTGSVKRFKQESVSSEPGRVPNPAAIRGIMSSGRVKPQGVADGGTVGEDVGDKSKLDYFTNSSSSIAKIIKVVSYSASISNNVQDASVNFLVLRSDGKEMVVDNDFLKTTNPLLLINYYEQHLRYSPLK